MRRINKNNEKQVAQVDPAELARLRQESRNELAKSFEPSADGRISSCAIPPRLTRCGANFADWIFRRKNFAIYVPRPRRDGYSSRNFITSGDDPVKLRRKQELEAQRETRASKSAWRGKLCHLQNLSGPAFPTVASHRRSNWARSAEMVLPIYQINQVTEAERQRIREDPSLSNEEKIDALAATQAEQQKSLEKILGPEAFQEFIQGQATNSLPR